MEGDPSAPCLSPTYSRAGPGSLALSHPQHSSLVTELCSTTEETEFFRGTGWKISSIWLVGERTSCFMLLCAAWHGFSLVLHFSFHRFSTCVQLEAFKNNCIRCVHMAGQPPSRSRERGCICPLPWAFQEPSLILC